MRNEEQILEKIRDKQEYFKRLKKQTPERCRVAVEAYPYNIKYVKEQTPELCMSAVSRKGMTLYLVKSQTPELCMAAVKENGEALQYVNEKTPELCLAAVKQDGDALEYVENQTEELCRIALKDNPWALEDVKIGHIIVEYLKKDIDEYWGYIDYDRKSALFQYLLTITEELPTLLGLCGEMDELIENVLKESQFLKEHPLEDWKRLVATDQTRQGYEEWLTGERNRLGLEY